MAVTKDTQVVLQGTMEVMAVLWRVTLQILDRPINQIKNLNKFNGNENSINYIHAAVYSPVQDTWERVVNMVYFNTWPGITKKDINKMPKAEATIKGHLAHSIKKRNTSVIQQL